MMNKFDDQPIPSLLHRLLLAKTDCNKSVQCEQDTPQVVLTLQAKYFLFRVFNTYGFDCPISEPIRLLVPNLGISYKTIAQVKKKLSAVGILSLDQESDGAGHPVDSFYVHSDCLERVLESLVDELPEVRHESMIESLLCWGERDDEACQNLGGGTECRSERAFLIDENHNLDAKSRIFLAVLFAHADEFGFVESLGHADIETLTGLDSDKQRRLVKKLTKSGYIRSVMQGFTNPKVFGRIHTVYCLKTQFSGIDGLEPQALTVLSETLFRQAHEKSESSQLFQTANPNALKKKYMDDTVVVFVRSFVGQDDGCVRFKSNDIDALRELKTPAFYAYLQYRLESYACMFLSMPEYQGQKPSISKSVNQNILEKIQCDVSGLTAGEQSTDDCQKLSMVLYRIACEMAGKYYELLSEYRSESLRYSHRQFRVLPRNLDETLTLCIVSNEVGLDNDFNSCVHIHSHITDINRGPKQITVCDESELDEMLRLSCGLGFNTSE